MKSQFTNDQINEVMEQRGINRKSALKFLNREHVGKASAAVAPAKSSAPKKAKSTKPQSQKTTNANRAAGIALFNLAGRPSKSDFIKVYGTKKAIAWTWAQREAA